MSLPIPRFGSWATETNYPSGSAAWNGQPLKVQPVGDYFTPNVKPPAENLNWLLNQIGGGFGDAMTLTATIAVANWNPWQPNPQGVSSGNTAVLSAACWDSWYGQWLVGAQDANASYASLTLGTCDGGKTWLRGEGGSVLGYRQIGTDAGYEPIAMAVDPVGGTFCAVSYYTSATAAVSRCPVGSGVNVTIQPAPMANATVGALMAYDGVWYFVGANAGSGTYAGMLSISGADGVGEWTDETSELPASWQSGTSTIAYYFSAWNAQSGAGTQIVFGMSGKTAGTDVSRLLLNAGAWTDVTPSVMSGMKLTGLAYSAFDALWGILLSDGTNAYLYTSPDLATWTRVKTWVSAYAEGLAVIGSVWAVVVDLTAPSGFGNRIVYSTNVGALGASSTWSGADYYDPYSAAGLAGAGCQSILLSSGTQLLRLQTGRSAESIPGETGGSVAISLKLSVDDLVVNQPPLSAATPSGAPGPILMPLTTGASQESGTVIPAGYAVLRAAVVVTTPFSAGTTMQVGQPGSESLIFGTGVVDDGLGTAGTYDLPVVVPTWGGTALPVLVTLGGSPTEGAGYLLIEYGLPTG